MTLEEEAMSTLQEIRQLADEVAKLEGKYLLAKEKAKLAKESWESAQASLTELCRSHRTSEEVASRPLIKAVEEAAEANGEPAWVKDTFAALLSVGHTEDQARKAIDRLLATGKTFSSVNDAIDAIYRASMAVDHQPPADDEWRELPVEALIAFGLPEDIPEILSDLRILTLGQLDAFKSQEGSRLAGIVGDERMPSVVNAWSKFCIAWSSGERPTAPEVNGEALADHEEDPPEHHGEPVEGWEEAKDRKDEAEALEMIETVAKAAKPKRRKARAKGGA